MTVLTVDWAARRRAAEDRELSRALELVAFPVSLDDAFGNAELRDPVLREWARESLRTNRVRHTAQLEMLAGGRSLADIAWECLGREHGSTRSIRQTLDYLSRWPEDEAMET